MFKIKIYYSDKTGKLVRCIICDLGYRIAVISYDICLISELLRKPIEEVYALPPNIYDISRSN